MRLPDKRKRIDSDSGYLLVSPAEWAELERGRLDEDDAWDFPGAYRRTVSDLVRKKKFLLKEICRMEKVDPEDEASALLCMQPFGEKMGELVGRLYGRSRLRFVDWGSFKFCAVFDGGYALKVSVREGGMKGEVDNLLKWPGLTCFPRLVDRDPACDTCVVEAVDPRFGEEECGEFYGVARFQAVELLDGRDPENPAEKEFLRKLESEDGPEWKSLRDLRKFF
jgi:hypothetical protein